MNESRKKILVTGASGFIGKHLALALVAEGYEVASLARRPQSSPAGVAEFITDGSYSSIVSAIQSFHPQLVIHLATLYLPQHRPEDLDALVEGNISFGLKLLEAMVKTGLLQLINTGTMFQHYGNSVYSPINLYAAMKQAFEDLIQHYAESNQVKVIHLKISDSYGSNDTRVKVYSFLKRALETREKVEFSPGEQLVDPVHIDDVVAAYLLAVKNFSALTRDQPVSTFRISSENAVSLKTLSQIFEEVSGQSLNIAWGAKPYRVREVRSPYSRFEWVPGWKPKISLKQGIARLLSEN